MIPGHAKPLDAAHCELCARYHSDARYRELVDRGVAKQSTPLPCVHLGKQTGERDCPTCAGNVRLKVFACSHPAHTETTIAECQKCDDNPAKRPKVEELVPVQLGVVIGAYKWPRLIDLQIRVIRDTCGPVPILVSDDCSPDGRDKEIESVCASHPDVRYWGNFDRIGHTGGDLAAFWKGVKWGAKRGLHVIAKLSQRFVVTRSNWLQEGAKELLESGCPIATQRCRGVSQFDLRTEAALLNVSAWNNPDTLSRITPREYWKDAPRGITAETILFRTLQDTLGGIYWPWSLVGEERYEPRDGVVWHCANRMEDYHALAARHGGTLDSDFTCDGWQRDEREGLYRYG